MKYKLSFLLISLVWLCSCKSKRLDTPDLFKNKTVVGEKKYFEDTTAISKSLKEMVSKHFSPFGRKDLFDEDTELKIDTLIYSPDKLRMVTFVISKNNTEKLVSKDVKGDYFYNANFLYCNREVLNSPIKVYDYIGFRLEFYSDYDEIKNLLRDYCFLYEFSAKEKTYNLDDSRFWRSEGFDWVIENSKPTEFK